MRTICLLLCVAGAKGSDGVDSIFAPLTDGRSPGLAVLMLKHGQVLFERGYGVRDLRTLSPIDEKTNFRLASVTKQFTATAIMLLVRDGKLRYDEKLTGVFPDFPGYGRTITIRHLLTHTSGLPDYEDLMGQGWPATHQIQGREVLDLLKRQPGGKFAAGTRWAYSNSGYVVLGLMVAKVSGVPFERFLHDRIFARLGMQHTLAYVSAENVVPDRAFGHTGLTETDQSSTSATLGDGGVYSNLEDLRKWDQALQRNLLLSRREMRAALTPAKLADGSMPRWPLEPGDENLDPGQPVAYGFGWFLDPYKGHQRMWHYGSTVGFGTAIERFPQEGVTIIVLCNRTDLDPAKLALQAADAVLAKHSLSQARVAAAVEHPHH